MMKTAIILAGGKSRRMGKNKAFLKVDGQSFIKVLLEKIMTFDERLIVANDVELYKFTEATTIKDIYPDKGPLCGLYTGLQAMKGHRSLVVTVDTPLLTEALLDYLWSLGDNVDCVIPVVDGRRQPLCAVYNKSALPVIEEAVKRDERRVQSVLDQLKVREVTEEELQVFGDPKLLLSNINTPEEYRCSIKG